MATTAGAVSKGLVGSTTAQVISAAATGGTGPYTYQWYRSTVSGFTPSGANDIVGATTLEYTDSGLVPGTQYYYKMISTDSGAVAATSLELSVLTETAQQSQNQFVQSPYLGMLDLRYNPDTIAVQFDSTVTGLFVAGQAVKASQEAGGVPRVVPVTADTDVVMGFINFNIKDKAFTGLDFFEISMDQNVMYLMSTEAIARLQRVTVDPATVGGVKASVSGKPVTGFALDVANAGGQLVRIKLTTPSYSLMP